MSKTLLALFFFALFASPIFAQDQVAAARASAGCGPAQTEFDVKTDKKQHPAPAPEAGKALIYVFEEVDTMNAGTGVWHITTRVGLDGAWVGANSNDSYFFFPADPGDHRLCTNWQSSVGFRSKQGSAASFTAEAGMIYYFRLRIYSLPKDAQQVLFKLEPLDPAEAQFLIASASLATSKRKSN